MQPRVKGAHRASACLPIFTLIAAAHAESLTYGVDAGVGETDNVTLAHEDKISQTLAVADFDVDYQQKSQRLDVNAKGNFSYLDYLQGAYGGKLFGRFDGTGELGLIPQRLTWVLQENYGQATINPFTPSTPTNLENINHVATGPDLHLRLGGASFFDLSARVGRTEYESSPYTNTQTSGNVAWGLKLSALSSVSVNGDTERVSFENTVLNTDFERSNAFLRYELQGARTELSTDLGATVVGQRGESTTGALARFNLSRRISPSARLHLTVGRDIIDAGTSFSGLQGATTGVGPQGGAGVVGAAPATNTSSNYTSDYGSVGWDYHRNRTTLELSGRWEKDTYAGHASLDRTMTTGELRLQRLVTRAFALQVTGRLFKTDYDNAILTGSNGSPNTATSSIAAAVTWRHGRALEVKLAGEHTSYATSPNDTGYKENRVILTVGYRPLREPVGEEAPDT